MNFYPYLLTLMILVTENEATINQTKHLIPIVSRPLPRKPLNRNIKAIDQKHRDLPHTYLITGASLLFLSQGYLHLKQAIHKAELDAHARCDTIRAQGIHRELDRIENELSKMRMEKYPDLACPNDRRSI